MIKEKINQYYKNKKNYRDDSKLHVSQASKCPRAAYFKAGDYEGEDMEPRVLRIFDNGDSYHQRIMRAIYESGIEVVASEVNIPDNDLVLGRCDCIVSIDGENYVVDFKSISSGSWHYTCEKGQDKKSHVCQLNLYMDFLDIDKGILLYENKDTQELHEKIYEYDESKAEEDIDWLKNIQDHIKEKRVPEKPSKEWLNNPYNKCEYCNYKKVCRKVQDEKG